MAPSSLRLSASEPHDAESNTDMGDLGAEVEVAGGVDYVDAVGALAERDGGGGASGSMTSPP